MKTALLLTCVVTLALVVGAPSFFGTSVEAATDADEIEIMVSPGTIVLDSEGTWVTVHADIRYWVVDSLTLSLNGIPVTFTKADDRGDLVAKFNLDDVKDILDEDVLKAGCVELRLDGTTKDDEDFGGVDTVRVVKGGRN